MVIIIEVVVMNFCVKIMGYDVIKMFEECLICLIEENLGE